MVLAYKANCDFVFERLRRLYCDKVQDEIFAVFNLPSPAIKKFVDTHTLGPCEYPDPKSRIIYWDELMKERYLIEDDSIPNVYLSEFDQGLNGAMVGGEVEYSCFESGWISSMCRRILNDWSEIDQLRINKQNIHFLRYLKQLKIFTKAAEDKFGISHLMMISGFNFAFELFGGTETYMGMYEHAEELKKVLNFSFDLNIFIQNKFFEHVPLINGGTCCTLAEWLPGGRNASESIDPFHMTSVDTYWQWGHEHVQRIFDEYEGGFLHIHGNGRHLIESAAQLNKLSAIFLGDDTGFPPALDVIDDLKSKAGEVPIIILADYTKFADMLKARQLPGGVLYRVMDVPEIDQANKMYEDVVRYRI